MKKIFIIGLVCLLAYSANLEGQCSLNMTITQPIPCAGPLVATVDFSATNVTMPVSINIDSLFVLNYLGFPVTQPLFPGTYVVTLNDGSGCIDVDTLVIEGIVNGYATSYGASCLSCSNGAAIVHINNGLPPYFFSWFPNTQDTASYVHNLMPGSYTCYITDSSGCVGAINSNIGYNEFENTLSGNLFFDINKNGVRDGVDYGLYNKKIQLSTQFDTVFTWSDTSGNYVFFVDSGSFVVSVAIDTGFIISTDSVSYSLNVISPLQISNLVFGVESDTVPVYDGNISLSGNLPRCNSDVNYCLKFTNKCNQDVNAVVKLIKPSSVQYVSSSATPMLINGDTIIWNCNQLSTGNQQIISIVFALPNAPGSVIQYKGILELSDSMSYIVFSDSSSLSQLIQCSFDPNNKMVSPIDSNYISSISKDDYIYYTINFQNTGTDTAFNVRLIDTLDAFLDVKTFDFLMSSHFSFFEIKNNILTFDFNNILLPDSNINENKSHGTVSFRIKTLANLSIPNSVDNLAYIFFDANAPIATNVVVTILQQPLGIYVNPFKNNTITIFPNPTNSVLTVKSTTDINSIQILSSDIKLVKDFNYINHNTYTLGMESFSSGIYILKINCHSSINYYKLIKK